ncbi:hypothetical protein [Cyclobacterium jeungdonense]|uniref:Receptor L-domain domain-containing protein n=1 Tax=Cyclobacterium jeungdonense TaxID=708087 RepID=A0ABT8C6P2_9BACT|nr:hypothetical protein [Cyclobacterium jeungdonense]MDN3687468.1 hypothetical protein [Cyclobacterium jeungdonense]
MKNFPFSSLLAGVVMFLSGASCTPDPTPVAKPSAEISLSIDLDKPVQSSVNGRITSERLQEVESIWVAIEDANGMLEGFPKKFDDFVLDGNTIRFEIFNLPIGRYQLTKLWLEDARGEVIYATPLEGSPLSSAITEVLPIQFEATTNNINSVTAESLSTKGYSPEDFGLNATEVMFREELACDGGTFEGSVHLLSQKMIEDFGALCYTKIVGDINIIDHQETIDLSPLNSIREIEGDLIIRKNTNLTSLNGLENLSKVGWLLIAENESLNSLQGLQNLREVKSKLYIQNNPQIANLEGLENLKSVKETLRIFNIPGLINLNGLNNLNNCHSLEIIGNENLTSIEELKQLTETADINLADNPKLESFWRIINQFQEIEALRLSGLEIDNFENKIPENFEITSLLSLRNIIGLKNLKGLPIIKELTTSLEIADNPNLESLEGLGNLLSIGVKLYIDGNPQLKSLNGLENLETVGEIIQIGSNENLVDFCALKKINTGNSNRQPNVTGNAHNPDLNNLSDENCSN